MPHALACRFLEGPWFCTRFIRCSCTIASADEHMATIKDRLMMAIKK